MNLLEVLEPEGIGHKFVKRDRKNDRVKGNHGNEREQGEMCTALKELKMQGIELEREEGRVYGAISAYRDFKLPEEEILKMLQENLVLLPGKWKGI